ncbi:MAG: VOC family protein [Polyangiaceae bacterium]|nr:VOC family protein [Polyangiaceae bacterium]
MDNKFRHGQFVWRELMTKDATAAKEFYAAALGWTSKDVPMPQGTYTLFSAGDLQVGGMMQMDGQPSAWMSYASVADADATMKAAEDGGGKVLMPAMSVPGVGRFGVFMDPTGGVVGVLRNETTDGPTPERPPLGSFCWETLNTTNIDQAKAFYTKVFNWTPGSGPGNFLVFLAGEAQVCDVENAPPGMPSHWLLHVVVDKLESAREKAEKAGAKILMGEIPIPQIGRICVIADPTGAALSLFEPDMSGMSA